MDLTARLDLGELRLRTLLPDDADLLVEATRQEQGRALWGPRPAGPYSLDDARTALQQWDPAEGKQASYGVLRADRLVAAVGLMLDSPHGAELAYWVRPEERRRGIGVRSVQAVTAWAHRDGGLARLWLEIDPANTASRELARRAGYQLERRLPGTAAPGSRTIPLATSGTTASSSPTPGRARASGSVAPWWYGLAWCGRTSSNLGCWRRERARWRCACTASLTAPTPGGTSSRRA
jgi:RimJ/RimL family protein N-acetyltransferase